MWMKENVILAILPVQPAQVHRTLSVAIVNQDFIMRTSVCPIVLQATQRTAGQEIVCPVLQGVRSVTLTPEIVSDVWLAG